MRAAIYARYSSDLQSAASIDDQVRLCRERAAQLGYEVVEVLKETVSGRADETDRHGLIRAEELAATGKIKKVLVHEISRLSRKNSITHRFIESLENYGVSLYWHSQGIETLLANGKRNPSAGIMVALLSEIARAEVETLRERIMSGLAEARKKGVKLGRPAGSKNSASDLIKKHQDIIKLLKNGHSVRHTTKITGKGFSTVQRVKKVWNQSNETALTV